jgi:hypothetical protein
MPLLGGGKFVSVGSTACDLHQFPIDQRPAIGSVIPSASGALCLGFPELPWGSINTLEINFGTAQGIMVNAQVINAQLACATSLKIGTGTPSIFSFSDGTLTCAKYNKINFLVEEGSVSCKRVVCDQTGYTEKFVGEVRNNRFVTLDEKNKLKLANSKTEDILGVSTSNYAILTGRGTTPVTLVGSCVLETEYPIKENWASVGFGGMGRTSLPGELRFRVLEHINDYYVRILL